MPTTNSTNQPPKHRKQLNEQQIEILLLLYKFRFATPDLIIQYQQLDSRRYVNMRLKILMDQEYLGRRYDSSYRIERKQARYYLLPKAIRFLKDSEEDLDPKGLNLLYYNRSASEGFVSHCLSIFQVYHQLDVLYGQSLEFFTRSEIAELQRFPWPLPDGFLVLEHKQADNSEFMLELLEADTLWSTVRRRAKRYFKHYEDEWDDSQGEYPTLLLLCEGSAMERQVQRLAVRLLDRADSEIKVYTTTVETLLAQKSRKTAVWSDVTEPEELQALNTLSVNL